MISSILGFNSTHKNHAIKKTQVIIIMKTYPLLWWSGAKNTIVQCSIWLHFPRLVVVWNFRTPFVSNKKKVLRILGICHFDINVTIMYKYIIRRVMFNLSLSYDESNVMIPWLSYVLIWFWLHLPRPHI